jgi:hypothetical protein
MGVIPHQLGPASAGLFVSAAGPNFVVDARTTYDSREVLDYCAIHIGGRTRRPPGSPPGGFLLGRPSKRPDPPVSLRRAGACHNAPLREARYGRHDPSKKQNGSPTRCMLVDLWVARLGGPYWTGVSGLGISFSCMATAIHSRARLRSWSRSCGSLVSPASRTHSRAYCSHSLSVTMTALPLRSQAGSETDLSATSAWIRAVPVIVEPYPKVFSTNGNNRSFIAHTAVPLTPPRATEPVYSFL